jgi:Domain of unknown function (DUF4062)/Putative ATP-dependent DNA helicase recG C-terminal
MTAMSPSKFGPEVLLIFIGHSEDADGNAEAVLGVEHDLQRVLEQHLEVASGSLPFKTVRLWEWNRDAPPEIGGQEQVITPIIDRANAAVFLFKERVGRVTWSELERCRDRKAPAIAVLAFFPDHSPDGNRMTDPTSVAAWLELLEKKRTLTTDWTASRSRSLTPMAVYRDADHLKALVLEQLKVVIARLLRSEPLTAVAVPPPSPSAKFLADHAHLNYDRRPVLTHTVEELDQNLLRSFLEKPLSQEPVFRLKLRGPDRPTMTEHLRLLGCLSDGRPTLGAFLCFAPPSLLADKFDCCCMQLVVYSSTARASSRPSITSSRGNLLALFEDGMLWLTTQAGLRRRGRVGAADRDELEIPEIVLREVLANALVHRDYETPALKDQPTRVEVYTDRVEITSFGGLSQTVPVESLNNDPERIVPYRRNPVIARVFQHLSHVELNASGVPRMHSEMEKAELPPPRFTHDLHESIVRVVLLRPSEWAEAPEMPVPTRVPSPSGPRRVFISSTSLDLPEHHRAVIDACLRMGYSPVAMEFLSAESANTLHSTLELVDQADIYVGILGYRYGFVPPGQNLSITEMEYNRAVERHIPSLVFIMDADHPIRPRDIEKGSGAIRLEQLKERVRHERVVSYFRSPEQLRAEVIESLGEWRERLPRGQHGDASPDLYATQTRLPVPPVPYVAHPYTLGLTAALVGRHAELDVLTSWVAAPGSESYSARLFCIVALGGMGKSALAWKWFQDIAPQTMKPLAGRVWWSFYESDATFENFVARTLAYVSRQSLPEVEQMSSPDRESALLTILDREPFLLVIDGLERLLMAYRRVDVSSLGDDELDQQTDNVVSRPGADRLAPTASGREDGPAGEGRAGPIGLSTGAATSFRRHLFRTMADPRAGVFLRKLTQTRSARILVTTRLHPAELQSLTGGPIPGSKVWFLEGLSDPDVLELWRALGVRGSRDTLLSLGRRVQNHPLVLQVLAGVVGQYRKAPGDLDSWLQENPAFDVYGLSLTQVRSHVLEFALRGLDERGRSILAAVAACHGPASYESLSKSLVGAGRPIPSDAALNDVLGDLEERGLINWDRKANQYDSHPIIRAVILNLCGI